MTKLTSRDIENLKVIYQHPDKHFDVDKKGHLNPISKWNIIGRLIVWLKDRHGAVTIKVQNVVGDLKQKLKSDTDRSYLFTFNSKQQYTVSKKDLCKRVKAVFDSVTDSSNKPKNSLFLKKVD